MSKSSIKKIIPFLPIFILVIVVAVLSYYIPKETVQNVVVRAGVFAPLVYSIISLSTFVFAPLSNTPIIAIGYYVFGGDRVIIYNFLTVLAGCIINFWVARKWGLALVIKLVGKKNMEKVNEFTKDHGLLALFVSRSFLWGFNDFISYAAGLTPMKFIPYLLVTILALIPGTLIIFYSLKYITNVAQFTFLVLGLSALFFLLFPIAKKYFKSKK